MYKKYPTDLNLSFQGLDWKEKAIKLAEYFNMEDFVEDCLFIEQYQNGPRTSRRGLFLRLLGFPGVELIEERLQDGQLLFFLHLLLQVWRMSISDIFYFEAESIFEMKQILLKRYEEARKYE